MNYDVLLFPRKTCKNCGNELDIKMSIEQKNQCIKFYHTCNKCKTTACDTLKLVNRSKVECKTPAP